MIIYLEDRLPHFRWECSSIHSLTKEPSRNVSWISSVYHLPLICWWWPKANCGCVRPTSQIKRIRKTQQRRTNCLHKQFEFNLQKTVFHFPFPQLPLLPLPIQCCLVRSTGSITALAEEVEDLENELLLKTSFGLFVFHRIVQASSSYHPGPRTKWEQADKGRIPRYNVRLLRFGWFSRLPEDCRRFTAGLLQVTPCGPIF